MTFEKYWSEESWIFLIRDLTSHNFESSEEVPCFFKTLGWLSLLHGKMDLDLYKHDYLNMEKGKTNIYIFYLDGTNFAKRMRGMTVRRLAVGWSVSFIPHTVLHCNILDCIVLDCNVWHCIISDWIVLESTALYATQLLYIGVHCTLCLGTVHKLWQPYLGVSVTVERVNLKQNKTYKHVNWCVLLCLWVHW